MSTHNPDRRKALRTAAMLGLVLAGCQKKEEMPGAPQSPSEPAPGTPPPGPSGSAPGAGATPQTGGSEGAASAGAGQGTDLPRVAKISQAQAQYQNMPKGDQNCANCMHFVSPDSCKLVEGKISPEGWCMLWAKKA
jgi:hypothetical protein